MLGVEQTKPVASSSSHRGISTIGHWLHLILPKGRRIHRLWAVCGVVLALIVASGVVGYLQKERLSLLLMTRNAPMASPVPDEQLASKPTRVVPVIDNMPGDNTVLFKVGKETLWQSDYEYLANRYPTAITEETKGALKEKLKEDSILLQEAIKLNLITADSSYFDTKQKDQSARIAKVAEATTKLQNTDQSKSTTGEYVALWFMNSVPGPVGYEKGREIALATITDLHSRVKSGELTMRQAGDLIKNNPELATVDPAYQSNAYLEYVVTAKAPIVFDLEADKVIRSTSAGGLTEVLTLRDRPAGERQKKEALFLFAKISNKSQADVSKFSSWLIEKKKEYGVANE